jgi:hypothetical protein
MPANAEPLTFTTAAGESPNNLYYSWDAGLVHYIALSTEHWFGVKDKAGKATLQAMLAWLEEDLKKANANRDAVPWVVAHGHRDIYCSTGEYDDKDCGADQAGKVRADLEPIFFEYGLDFWINGHEHSYERTYPMYQEKSVRSNVEPQATIYIVTGAAGSHEMHEGFSIKQPSWSAFRSNTIHCTLTVHSLYTHCTLTVHSLYTHCALTVHSLCTHCALTVHYSLYTHCTLTAHSLYTHYAFRSNTFGYSRMYVHNATHVHWQQVQTDPTLFPDSDYGRVIDDTWIVQHHHGPFSNETAPTGAAFAMTGPESEDPVREYDHWGAVLEMLDQHSREHWANATIDEIATVGGADVTDVFVRWPFEWARKDISTSALIRMFNARYGVDAWAQVEDELLNWANSKLSCPEHNWNSDAEQQPQHQTVWEDVRGEGNSDGAWFRWKDRHAAEM